MLRLNQRGSSMVDYIMMTALVAGIVVPVIYVKFGAPFMETLSSERGKLVNFIGQTPRGRKPPVPSTWFSQEKMGNTNSGDLPEPSELAQDGELNESGELKEPGQLRTGNLKDVKPLKEPGALTTGELGAGALPGGGGLGAGTGAGSSRVAGGSDFFSNPPSAPGASLRGEKGDEEIKGRAGGSSDDGGSNSSSGKLVDESGAVGQLKGGGKNDKKEEGPRVSDSKKRSLLEAEVSTQKVRQGGSFDWWLILKILIVLLIIALIFLILMGNTRRNG